MSFFSKNIFRLRVLLLLFFFIFLFNLLVIGFSLNFLQKQAERNDLLLITSQNTYQGELMNQVLGANTALNSEAIDQRVKILENFLLKYNSPLYPYAKKIILLSDQYGFHYGLLPSIAMIESNLCRKIPANSYNCWGWGIYGKTVTRFSSFDEALSTVALGLKENYIDHGFVSVEEIMAKYNPSNHNNWAGGVNYFLKMFD